MYIIINVLCSLSLLYSTTIKRYLCLTNQFLIIIIIADATTTGARLFWRVLIDFVKIVCPLVFVLPATSSPVWYNALLSRLYAADFYYNSKCVCEHVQRNIYIYDTKCCVSNIISLQIEIVLVNSVRACVFGDALSAVASADNPIIRHARCTHNMCHRCKLRFCKDSSTPIVSASCWLNKLVVRVVRRMGMIFGMQY